MALWEAEPGEYSVETYLDDLRTTPTSVLHAACFAQEFGIDELVKLAQARMIDLSKSLNAATLHIVALEDKLQEHRLLLPKAPWAQ